VSSDHAATDIEREVAEQARLEDEQEEGNILDKKRKKAIKGIEAAEDLDEEPPEAGYPDHTALPPTVGPD
jgi:hypothetical protein